MSSGEKKLLAGSQVRILVPLVLLLAGALTWLLVFESDRSGDVDPASGQRLLTVNPDSVHTIQVSAGPMATQLVRSATGWMLQGRNPGGPWQDRASTTQAIALVQAVALATAAEVLDGTEVVAGDTLNAWQPYGLLATQATRVSITTTRAETSVLWLGIHNPVTNQIYGRVSGRPGVFTLAVEPWASVRRLQESVRLWNLWPDFIGSEVRSLRLDRTGSRQPALYLREPDGTWWARLPSESTSRLGRVASSYQEHYRDRNRRTGEANLWRAQDRQLEYLVTLLQQCRVQEAEPLPASRDAMHAAGLAPPTVKVTVALPAAAPLTAAFGSEKDKNLVAVARDGQDHILWVSNEVLELLLSPLAEYLQTAVLNISWADVDSLVLQQTARRPLVVVQQEDSWQARVPDDAGITEQKRLDELCGDLVYHLQRLPIQVVRPPALDRPAWQDSVRTRLTLSFAGEKKSALVVELGMVAGTAEAVAYFPHNGKLLVIPSDLLVSLRALFTTLRL